MQLRWLTYLLRSGDVDYLFWRSWLTSCGTKKALVLSTTMSHSVISYYMDHKLAYIPHVDYTCIDFFLFLGNHFFDKHVSKSNLINQKKRILVFVSNRKIYENKKKRVAKDGLSLSSCTPTTTAHLFQNNQSSS